MSESQLENLSPVHQALVDGEVIVYPTEAVWGMGCDPRNQQAVEKVLAVKQRPVEKGLILIARDYGQILPFVNDDAIPMDRRSEIFSSWPGPFTWLLPAAKDAPEWITGGSELIAVRVTTHPSVRAICEEFNGAIVSTSANITGEPTPPNLTELQQLFGDQVGYYVDAELGDASAPSMIRNGMTGQTLRG